MNIMRIFITGRPGSGKTTLILRLVDIWKERGFKIGGFITQDIRVKSDRVGFKIKDLTTGGEGVLAHVEQKEGPQVSKYKVNIFDLDEIGVKALENAVQTADWVVIDEIGKMELYSKKFEVIVREILGSNKNILATVHWNYEHPLIAEIKRDYEVLEVTRGNWKEVFEKIKKIENRM